MDFTGQRAENFSLILALRRSRVLSAADYASAKARLVAAEKKHRAALKKRQEAREKARQVEAQKRVTAELAKMEKKEAERKAKRAEAARLRRATKKEKKSLDSVLLVRAVADEVSDNWLFSNVFKNVISSPMRLVIIRNGASVQDSELLYFPKYKDFRKQFIEYVEGEDRWIFETGDVLVVLRATTISAERIVQRFRDGISHCVFTPILTKLRESLENGSSKEYKRKVSNRIRAVEELSKTYAEGVPVDNMEEVALATGYRIEIRDLFGKKLYIFNEKAKRGVLRFKNLRENHLDEDHFTSDDAFVNVGAETMKQLYDEACIKWRDEKQFFHFEFIEDGIPKKLYTINGAYALRNEDYMAGVEFTKSIELNKYAFNASKYPEVNAFIKEGRIVNSQVFAFNEKEPTGHIDMPKAYTQFKKCAWYAGFMGVVHQWRTGQFDRAFIEENIGIYRCKINCESAEHANLFTKLGLSGWLTLPSVEILYLMDSGCSFEIVAGAWGSRFDFEFTPEMLVNRRYCHWSGRLGMENWHKTYSFYSSKEWASHLKCDYDASYWERDGICSVKIPKNNVYTFHHIFAFITSYVRIQMMEAMKKFKIDNLCKVLLDGIYFTGEKPAGLDWFVEKPIREHTYSGEPWYAPCEVACNFPSMWITRNTLLTGQGGAGKTYKVMTDTGFNRILFVTPCHVLGGDVAKKYGVSYTTIHKLIGIDCRPFKEENAYPPVVLIDEVTQISKEWIDKVFELYPSSLIILAGDLNMKQWFQCRNGTPGNYSTVWKPSGVDVIHIAGDRRSRDAELASLKLRVRSEMERVFVDGDTNEEFHMRDWALKNLKITPFFDACAMFSKGDAWIAGTHKTSDNLMRMGIVSGYYKKGGFISFEEKEGYEKRGSFTVHSFQGRTLESGKIFISVNDLFEYAMLYTAISRAVSFSQLVFVA